MTFNKEEYLKIIYEHGGEKVPVANKLIADELGVAPSSVSEMINKLKKEGLIETQPYKGAILTKDGLLISMSIIRNHRLWEVFLVERLGYSWREAHEEAHLLEHIATTRLMKRLDAFLGNPSACPHGSLIPQENEMEKPKKLFLLSELRRGQQAIIRRVSENVDLLDYLQRVGVQINADIQIRGVSDYEGPIIFNQNDELISISYKASREVFVEIIS